jgi:hypothetical protein
MGSGFKKKEVVDMGNYAASDKEQTAYLWCIKNGIKISPTAKNNKEWYLTIDVNSKVARSPITYEKVEIWKQLYKFYLYYYNKHYKIDEEVKDIKKVEIEKEIKPITVEKQQSLF